jgi:uncharacterized protein (TIGR02271 family)
MQTLKNFPPNNGREDPKARRSGAKRRVLVLPVAAEDAVVGKRVVETGRVRVQKVVRERMAVLDEPLRRDEVTVERIPVDRLVSEPPVTREDGDVLVIPVVEEVLIKGLRLVEEIRITRRRHVERRAVKVPLRREQVLVDGLRRRPPR